MSRKKTRAVSVLRGGVCAGLFSAVSIGWTIDAIRTGASWDFVLFGIAFSLVFVLLTVCVLVNAIAKGRFFYNDAEEQDGEDSRTR